MVKKSDIRNKAVAGTIDRVLAVHDVIAEVRERCAQMADSLIEKKKKKASLTRNDVDLLDSKHDMKVESNTQVQATDTKKKRYVDEDLAEMLPSMKRYCEYQVTNIQLQEKVMKFLQQYEKLQNHERELSEDRSRVLLKLKLNMVDSRFDYFSDQFPSSEHAHPDTLCNPELSVEVRDNAKRLKNLDEMEKRWAQTDQPLQKLVKRIHKSKLECEGVSRKLDVEQTIKLQKGPIGRLKETLVFLTPEIYGNLSEHDRRKVMGLSVLSSRNLQKLHEDCMTELAAKTAEYDEKYAELQHMTKTITTISNNKKSAKSDKRAELVEWCTNLMHQINQMDKTIKKGTEHATAAVSNLKDDYSDLKVKNDSPVKHLNKMIDALNDAAFSPSARMRQPWDDDAMYSDESDKQAVMKLHASFSAIKDLNHKFEEEMNKIYKITNKFVPKAKYGPINQVWKVPAQPDLFPAHVEKCLTMLKTVAELMADVVDFRIAVCEGIKSMNHIKLSGKITSDIIMFNLCQNQSFQELRAKTQPAQTQLQL